MSENGGLSAGLPWRARASRYRPSADSTRSSRPRFSPVPCSYDSESGPGVHAVPVAQRGGPVDGVGVVTAEHDRRAARPVRPGADDEAVTLVVAAVVRRPGARPRLAADLDQLDRAADALAAMTTEALELDVPVAESEADHAAATGQHVEERTVLGHPDRIVQRRQGEAEADGDARRRLDHRRGVRRTDPTNRASWKWCSLTHTLSRPTCSA